MLGLQVCTHQLVATAVRLLLGSPASHREVGPSSSASGPASADVQPGRKQHWFMFLQPCHPRGILRWSSWLLGLDCTNLSYENLGSGPRDGSPGFGSLTFESNENETNILINQSIIYPKAHLLLSGFLVKGGRFPLLALHPQLSSTWPNLPYCHAPSEQGLTGLHAQGPAGTSSTSPI